VNTLEEERLMNQRFRIESKRSNGNLHLHPKGTLDGSSACELIRLLHEQYQGRGSVFIETRDLDEVHPFGCSTFRGRLDLKRLPADRIFFKGEKGFQMAPEGSRVLIVSEDRKPRCDGRCENCTCGKERVAQKRG
jgi:hypothetical protein